MLCGTLIQAVPLPGALIMPASLQLQAAEAQRRAALRADAPRDPGHMRMEELRALQQAALTPDDVEQRFRAAQAIKPVRPPRVRACAADPPGDSGIHGSGLVEHLFCKVTWAPTSFAAGKMWVMCCWSDRVKHCQDSCSVSKQGMHASRCSCPGARRGSVSRPTWSRWTSATWRASAQTSAGQGVTPTTDLAHP